MPAAARTPLPTHRRGGAWGRLPQPTARRDRNVMSGPISKVNYTLPAGGLVRDVPLFCSMYAAF